MDQNNYLIMIGERERECIDFKKRHDIQSGTEEKHP